MNLIRLDPVRWPYSLGQLRQDEPSYSFSANPSKAEFAYFDVYYFEDVVTLLQPPGFDPETHWLQQRPPIEVNGVLTQQWALIAYTDEELEARYKAAHPPRWVDFTNAVLANPAVAALYDAAPSLLCHGLTGGLLQTVNASDSRTFVNVWGMARSAGLVSTELLNGVQALAAAHDLPEEFMQGLGT
jgi:hypothetical protein